MIIKILLILLVLFIAFYILGRRNANSGRAWQKIGLVLLFLLMIIVVIFPDLMNKIANLIGVGRGADLLLYGTVIVLVFSILINYLKQQDQRDKTYRIARKLALLEALRRYNINESTTNKELKRRKKIPKTLR